MIATIMLSTILLFFLLIMLVAVISNRNKIVYDGCNTRFSIIICCKNEEQNLERLFNSLRKLKYPGEYEIILVDDNSTDNTYEIMSEFCSESQYYHVFRLADVSQQGKKYALQYGIEKSQYEWIVLTDADCIVPPDWLEEINKKLSIVNCQLSIVIGYSPEIYKTSFQYFKQVATAINYAASTYAGIPVSCNGRNLIFNKKAFDDVGGLNGLFQYPAGEDKLLMQRFKQHKKKIGYLPYPPVYTFPVEKDLLKNQNLRRYGVFKLSTIPWILGMSLIGLLLIVIPIEIFLSENYLLAILLLIILESYMVIGCILHKEKVKPIYLLFTVVFPYYLGFQIVRSGFKKWKWK